MTPGQELHTIIQSLLDWQNKHVKTGGERDLQVDTIVDSLDELEEDMTQEYIDNL